MTTTKIIRVLYAGLPETPVYNGPAGRKRVVNKVLLGTWLGVTKEIGDGWIRVKTAGPDGWMRVQDTRDDCGLKVFFIDVGQGDGCLIESPNARILVDGGPNSNIRNYLRGWQYSYLLNEGRTVDFDAVFVSHFDADHYGGLIRILNDSAFRVGRLYHNGIIRFDGRAGRRSPQYDQELGQTDAHGQPRGTLPTVLRTSFSSIADARRLLNDGGLQSTFEKFLQAAVNAHDAGRLDAMIRLTSRDNRVPGFADDNGLGIDVLGPVPTGEPEVVQFRWFSDASLTRNGHSLVLKLNYRGKTILLGGDLNSAAENHLMEHYQANPNTFRVDVAKSCHHGSSDFTVSFMEALGPYATVISSGDNESYAHPRADALGAAGRYSRGRSPLVFSTELARSITKGGDILYGMINLRTDGQQVVMAQMKEKRTGSDVWDSYTIPFKPKRP